MNTAHLTLAGATFEPMPNGALWWAEQGLLAVSDMHLGRSERIARLGGGLIPPYETEDTLNRLAEAVRETGPRTVVSLGDSFDDLASAGAVHEQVSDLLTSLAAPPALKQALGLLASVAKKLSAGAKVVSGAMRTSATCPQAGSGGPCGARSRRREVRDQARAALTPSQTAQPRLVDSLSPSRLRNSFAGTLSGRT